MNVLSTFYFELGSKELLLPQYTKHDPETAENCRIISITAALSKGFENLLYKQIIEYFYLITCSEKPNLVSEPHIQ